MRSTLRAVPANGACPLFRCYWSELGLTREDAYPASLGLADLDAQLAGRALATVAVGMRAQRRQGVGGGGRGGGGGRRLRDEG